jgi:hypothetical protein
MAERHQLCRCRYAMPANACAAFCMERRDDVAPSPPEGDPDRAVLSLETLARSLSILADAVTGYFSTIHRSLLRPP